MQRYEPVPCVQVLFRVVAQVPVCLPELSHLFSADCLFGNQFAAQCRQSLSCVVFLRCAVEAEERLAGFPHTVDPECPVRVRCRILSQSQISVSLSRKSGPLLARIPLVCLPSAGNLRALASPI